MLCEHCHAKPATVHVMQVVNGEKSEQYLCQECAETAHVFEKEKSFFGKDPFGTSFGSLMSGAMEDFFAHPFGGLTKLEKGLGNFVELEEPGFLGGKSYGDFKEKLKDHMKKDQEEKSTDPSQEKEEDNELLKLKKELATFVAREEFERAAEVRDKIRAIEKSGNKK